MSYISMDGDMFLGKPVNYWLELDREAQNLNLESLLKDNANLRSRVSFYEDKLKEMEQFRKFMLS